MDISSLSPVNLTVSKLISTQENKSSKDFASLLEEVAETGEVPAGLTPEALQALLEDPNSPIPENIRQILAKILSADVLSDTELRGLSKQLFVHASGLADIVNFSSNPMEVQQADFDLQVVMVGMSTLVDKSGYKHALNDLVALWKKLDTRSSSFESLESSFIAFSQTDTLDLSGCPKLKTPEDKKQATFDLQYALWVKVSGSVDMERAKPLLASFEESQQMRLAKLEFKGESLDSLVDDVMPELEFES